MSFKLSIPKLSFAGFIFLLGLFIKQFYLRQSGTIQIGDGLISLSALLIFLNGKIRLRQDTPLAVFVLFTFIINGFYSVYYGRSFMISSVYLLFNLIVVIVFRALAKDDGFLRYLTLLLKFCLLTQSAIYFTGGGRDYSSLRYEGTFNDPNQFGFYVLCCFFILFLCYLHFNERPHVVWFLVTGFLVVLSTSRGMMLAYVVFLFFALIYPILSKKTALVRILLILLFALIAAALYAFGDSIAAALQGLLSWDYLDFVLQRIENTASANASGGGRLMNLLGDRQMIRIVRAPYYFLFGCGEGYNERFIAISGQSGEIHGTMIALCYYYGIIPYLFLLKWGKRSVIGIPIAAIGAFAAVIMEACTLANHRQPLFWMIFVLGSLLANRKSEGAVDEETKPNAQIQYNRTDLQGAELSK